MPPSSAIPTAGPGTLIEVPGALGAALGYVGPTPRSIDFTDWASIRATAGADRVTGASPFQDKAVAIRNEAPVAAFGVESLRTHAADWGFDVFDLDWEVAAAGGETNIRVLRFRETFDLGRFTAKLDAYGFQTEQLAGGVLRTGTMAAIQGRAPSLFLLNTGILADGRTLVLSALSPDPVRAILSAEPTSIADLGVRSIARGLGAPAAVSILATNQCREVAMALGRADARVQTLIDDELAAAGVLRPYSVFAVSYERRPQLFGSFVFGYAEAGDAEADLDGRRLLAETGISLQSRPGAPVRYADRYFVVADARVVERSIVIEVTEAQVERPSPKPGSMDATELLPRSLMTLFARRDLLFASCSA